MSAILSVIGAIFTAALSWVTSICTTIFGVTTVEGVTSFTYPILILFILLPLVGLGIGFFKRIISVQ